MKMFFIKYLLIYNIKDMSQKTLKEKILNHESLLPQYGTLKTIENTT